MEDRLHGDEEKGVGRIGGSGYGSRCMCAFGVTGVRVEERMVDGFMVKSRVEIRVCESRASKRISRISTTTITTTTTTIASASAASAAAAATTIIISRTEKERMVEKEEEKGRCEGTGKRVSRAKARVSQRNSRARHAGASRGIVRRPVMHHHPFSHVRMSNPPVTLLHTTTTITITTTITATLGIVPRKIGFAYSVRSIYPIDPIDI
ncbi:hypothetical protein M0802_013182 [Mischocyttarus mexicanus]|nr:hypothetical protein M0802_013182 [Mischocyttarus mexicanus]